MRPTLSGAGGITLDITTQIVDATRAPNLGLASPSNTGAYSLSVEVVNPFATHRDGNRLNLIGGTDVTFTGLPNSFLEGRPGVTQPGRTPIQVDASFSRDEVATSVAQAIGRATGGYAQQIVVSGGADIADGEIFTLSDGIRSATFEFDSGYSLQLPDLATDPSAYLDGETFIVSSNNAQTTFEFDSDGVTSSGNIGIRFNDIAINVPTGGVTFGGIADGQTFTIDQGLGTTPVVFEFDTNGFVTPNNVAVTLTTTSNQNDVANAMVLAIRQSSLGLIPVNRGQGQVQLGVTDHNVDLTNSPALTQQLVQVTQDEMASKVVNAIAGAPLGLSPAHLGSGLVHLGGNAGHSVDVTNAVKLQLTGSPGTSDPNAIVIPIFPSVATSAATVSQLVLAAINTAITTRGLNLTAVANGSRRIDLSGNGLVSEFSNAPSLTINAAGDSVKTYQNIVKVIGHTVSNPGPFGLESSLAGDSFGAFNTSGPPNATQYPGALRGMDNAHEGAYIDDIIIGFAERGEMITGATPNPNFVANQELLNPELQIGVIPHNEIHVGPYELEIRRADAFGITVQDAIPEILLTETLDTNDRLASQTSFTVPAGSTVADGQTIVISDGYRTVTLEFNDLSLNNGVQSGNIPVGYLPADSDVVMARRVRDVINASQVQALIKVKAGLSDGVSSGTTSTSNRINLYGNASVSVDGNTTSVTQAVAEPSDTLTQAIVTGIGTNNVVRFTGTGNIGDNAALNIASTDVDLFSIHLEAGQPLTVDVAGNQATGFFNGVLRVFDANGVEVDFNDNTNTSFDPHIDFVAPAAGTYFVGVSGSFNYFYNPQVAGSGLLFGGQFSTGNYTVTMSLPTAGFEVTEFDSYGDQNNVREQGQVLIEASRISQSSNFGILAGPGARDAVTSAAHQGSARLTREVNVANLAPGVTISNNILFRNSSGGVSFSGDTNVDPNTNAALPTGVIPFGRIYNNTIVGRGTQDVGILVGPNASPTLLNNILSNLGTGISVDGTSSSTVVGGSVYHRNGTPTVGTGLGSFPLDIAPTGALFVDDVLNNFYLAPGSQAIDSSVNSVQDRPELLAIKTPLGMSASPILAPDLDALGQARVDDPSVNTPTGQGGSVFKDRGAIDRADFTGPSAVMLIPADNDQQGKDLNGNSTFIELTNEILTNFSIQILDGVAPTDPREGTGADDSTVTSDRISVFRDGEKLIEGLDYRFHYDATNNIIRITPVAGIWETDRVYEIELSNSTGTSIQAPNGASVDDGDSFQITDEAGNQVTFEYDSGYVLQVPQTLALQVPANGGAGILDGDSFSITDGLRTVAFEFDSNGANANNSPNPPTQPNVIITFASTDSANDIANKLVAAINTTQLGLAPINIVNAGGRAVHLGTRSVHQVNTTLTSLQLTGQAGGIEPGQTFTIDDGTRVVTFEFVLGTTPATGTNRPISFTFNQTNEQIADAIAAAIRTSGVGLTPTHPLNSDGLIHVGGQVRHLINIGTSTLVLSGAPGVQTAWSFRIPTVAGRPDLTKILDGQTFSITQGTTAAVFEFDNNGLTTAGNRVIQFSAQTTTDQLANAIALAIRNAGVGLSPTNSGNGIVTLGGTTSHVADLSLSALTQLGLPGVAASVPVAFVPGDVFTPGIPVRSPVFSSEQMAQAIAAAINLAKTNNRLSSAVTVVVRDSEVITDGIATVSGISSVFTSNVRDIAGNALKPNRANGTTAFTVFVGSGLDYGDAPAPYPSTEAANGARHQVVGELYLGAGVDIDVDGQPDSNATGDDLQNQDDEDGVVVTQQFTGGYGGAVTVTASANGFLDAWVDFNRDGDWNDPGEQIFAKRALQPGANNLNVTVPGSALPGQTYARFRLSSAGGLSPTGLADDGEVEDHAIQVLGNPWRNPNLGMDVDNSGHVVPLDALIIINELNRNGPHALPNPPTSPVPPYLDANGDTFVTALDVLAVVNYLNSVAGEGEGDGTLSLLDAEGESGLAVDAESGSSLVTASTWNAPALVSSTALVDHRIGSPDSEADWLDETDVTDETGVDVDAPWLADVASAMGPQDSAWLRIDDGPGDDDDSWDDLLDGLAEDVSSADA
ncbi:MAG: GEVED domain-containing protein [Pirellulaceae bacterium]